MVHPSEIDNLVKLSNFLRCEVAFLEAFFDGKIHVKDRKEFFNLESLDNYESFVHFFSIPKRNKFGFREVHAIRTDNLRSALITLNNHLRKNIQALSCVHGYVPRRNVKTNAAQHLAKKMILSVDIKGFFDTISMDTVRQTLKKAGFTSFAADKLSRLTTINGHLVQGYTTSPALSNMVVEEMDQTLMDLCGSTTSYTRYADDLYFSTNDTLPDLEEIKSIIHAFGFELHPRKTKYMKRGQEQYVTGLTVFDQIMPRIPKQVKRRLRLEIHYIKKRGLEAHAKRKLGYQDKTELDWEGESRIHQEMLRISGRIYGWLHFMNSVEKEHAFKLSRDFEGT